MKEKQKQKAIEFLKQMGIYKPYIEDFEKEDNVCFFEGYGGYWVYQEPEIQAKMKELEKEYGCTVYAITHEFTRFGECWSFLLVTKYEEEWDNLLHSEKNVHYGFAYVWNKDDDWCSEFGTIGIKSFGGGITRFA